MDNEYVLYLTSRGASIVSGESKKAVLNIIITEPCSLSKIVSITKLPKSTVFSILNKFLADGLVQYEVASDGIGKIYSSNSVRLMSFDRSEDISFNLTSSRWGPECNLESLEEVPHICFITIMSAAGFSGVDLMPLYLDFGSQIGKTIIKDIQPSNCIQAINDFMKTSQIANIQSIDETAFSIDVLFPILSSQYATRMMGGFVGAIYNEAVNKAFNKNCRICSLKVNAHLDGCHIVIKDGTGIFPPNNSLHMMSFEIASNGTPALYICEKGVECVSALQEKILSSMAEGNTTLAEISTSIDSPLSTISFNLDRMGKLGLVKRASNGFVLSSIPCLVWKNPKNELSKLCDRYIASIAEDPENAYRYMICFVITNALRLGMDNRKVIYNTAKSLARFEYDALGSPPIEEVMDYLRNTARWTRDLDITVIGFRPFKVSIKGDHDLDAIIAETVNKFFGEFFCEMLKLINHGTKFRVVESIISGDGNRRHTLQIVPIST